jgi:hypothetical protein
VAVCAGAAVVVEGRVLGDVAHVGAAQQWRQRLAVRGVVQVPEHGHVRDPLGDQLAVDAGDPDRLSPPGAVGRDLPAVPLALEVVDQHRDARATG